MNSLVPVLGSSLSATPQEKTHWLRHATLALFFVFIYLLLNRPEVILVSKLGFTTWYPATGLVFALLLGISPRYAFLVCLADGLASTLIYHQPLLSWSGVPSPIATSAFYSLAAVVLHGRWRIDPALSRRVDVLRYIVATSIAALGSTVCGVAALVLDHTIAPGEFPRSAVSWFVGDEVALLALAPSLLIYVCPWIRKHLSSSSSAPPLLASSVSKWSLSTLAEATAQVLAIFGVLWVIFGPSLAQHQMFYLSFVPVIWVAMRNGIERAVIAILLLDFGIVAALHFYIAAPAVVAKAGLLMLVVSATGLIVGSAISERQYLANELRDRTVYLDSLTENSPFGIVVLDRTGRVELCNRAFENLFGFARAELIGNKLEPLISAPQLGDSLELSPQVYGGKSVQGNTRRTRKDGTPIDVEVRAVPLVIDGHVRGSYALYEDISGAIQAAQEKSAQQTVLTSLVSQLQSRTTEMTVLIELSDLLQCCSGLDEAYSVVNRFGVKLFSAKSSGSLSVFKSSRNVLELATSWGSSANPSPTFSPENCWALRRGKPHWSRNSAGGLVCAHLKDSLHSDQALCIPMVAQGDTIGVLQLQVPPASERNVSDEQPDIALERIASSAAGQIALSIASLKLRAALKDQSIRDPLTGLYNRRFMQEYLDRELPRARRTHRSFSFVFMDLDHFKRFNDSFGHQAGDHVLQVFAKTLMTFFRHSDVVCRFGGEEFALILLDSSLAQAEARINVLRGELKTLAFTHRDIQLGTVTFSAGIAAFPTHGSTAEELFRVADRCLYEAKKLGRDRVTVPTEIPATELSAVSDSNSSPEDP